MGQDIKTASTLDILDRGAVVYDSSHWGLLAISGNDRLRYLHNQSTNDFNTLQPGQGCDTVFVTSTARTIDLVTAYVLETAVWLLVSPSRRQRLLDWMDRFIFPADQVDLKDITDQMAVFRILGTGSQSLLSTLGATITGAYGDHQTVTLADLPCRLAIGSGLALPGYTLLTEITHRPILQAALVAAGAEMMDDQTWECLRIHQGRPLPDAELTEDYNPLEAGLWHTISFSKGCYIGQETIARLNTYNGVKQHLWGIRLNRLVPTGTPLMVGDQKVGLLTSIATPEADGTWQGLAYVRTKAGGVGLTVQVGDAQGEIVDVPYLTRSPL